MVLARGRARQSVQRRQARRYFGVITRTIASEPCKDKDITDGLSNTMVIGEKRVFINRYEIGDWHDDIGWTDGWDPDIVRYTGYLPGPDIVEGQLRRHGTTSVATSARPTPPGSTSSLPTATSRRWRTTSTWSRSTPWETGETV